MTDRTFTTEVQEPLVPAEVSFPSYLWAPLDINAITEGDLSFLPVEGFKAAIMLMMKSWQEKPAASLPDDDRKLAAYCGFGRNAAALAAFAAVKDQALSDFILCADKRYYSRTLAPRAIEAWESRKIQVARTEKARQAKLDKQRREAEPEKPATAAVSEPVTASVTENATGAVATSVTQSRLDHIGLDQTRSDRKASDDRSYTSRGGDDVKGGAGGQARPTSGIRPRPYEDFRGEHLTLKGERVGRYARDFPALASDIHVHLHSIDRGLAQVPENFRDQRLATLLRERNTAALRHPSNLAL